MRLLYETLARTGSPPRRRYCRIILDASAACLSAAVTPFEVMGSTMDAPSPAISQFGPATPKWTPAWKEVMLVALKAPTRSSDSKRENFISCWRKMSSTEARCSRLALVAAPVVTYPTLTTLGLTGISQTQSRYSAALGSTYRVVPSIDSGTEK